MVDIWGEQGDHVVKKRKVGNKTISIPAVEVEPPGCSYNPTSESHQDSLAHAVADEMQKVYTKELRPAPVPLTVDGEAINEEDRYFLDANNESDDDEEEKDEGEIGDADLEKSLAATYTALNHLGDKETLPFKTKRVTRVKLNRRARNKERMKLEAEVKKTKAFSKELDSLPEIIDEIAKEDEEKGNRHLRRVVAKQERLKSCPPRLGRHKFEPAPVQVLLSEEITGSLRKLKACCTLARDRYKSLEKRGIIVPTAKRNRSMFQYQMDQQTVTGEGGDRNMLENQERQAHRSSRLLSPVALGAPGLWVSICCEPLGKKERHMTHLMRNLKLKKIVLMTSDEENKIQSNALTLLCVKPAVTEVQLGLLASWCSTAQKVRTEMLMTLKKINFTRNPRMKLMRFQYQLCHKKK
ncbi:ribosome biogenesis protein NOP53 [Tanacetum coccineum]